MGYGDWPAIDAGNIMSQALSLFPCQFFSSCDVSSAVARLSSLQLSKFQIFLTSSPNAPAGQDVQALWKRGYLQAASQHQSKMPGAASSLAPLLPVGLTKEEHLNQARGLIHPFDKDVATEADLEFAIEGNARLGPLIHRWRNRQVRSLSSLFTTSKSLDDFAISMRPAHAALVSEGQPAVSMAVLI
eukprot:5135133-Karenia_brevis.AAC.1